MKDYIIGIDLAKDIDLSTFAELFFDIKLNKFQIKFINKF